MVKKTIKTIFFDEKGQRKRVEKKSREKGQRKRVEKNDREISYDKCVC